MDARQQKQEHDLIADQFSFANDPLGHVMYTYPWGGIGGPLEHFSGPRKWQCEVLEEIGAHTRSQEFAVHNGLPLQMFQEAIASGRGIGKSALLGMLANWHMSTHIGSTTIVTANTEKQLASKTFPEFARWLTMGINAHWWTQDRTRISPQLWLQELVRSQLSIASQYWYIEGQTWSAENPDAFAGAHNVLGLMLMFDEASGIVDPIWTTAKGFFTESNPYRYWLACSQGRRNSGAFFERFHDPELQRFWRCRRLDGRTVEDIDPSIFAEIIAQYGPDSDEARVEVYGEFPESGDRQFIPNSSVRLAQTNVFPWDDGQPIVMGIDPAPRGRTVVRFRQGRDARSIPPTVLMNLPLPLLVKRVTDLINKYNPDAVVCDAGQGTGLIDMLRAQRVKVVEVQFGSSPLEDKEMATRGGELWNLLKKWLPSAMIDESISLFNDLTKREWEWYGREDGRKILESKADLQSRGVPSPDDADALALTFAAHPPRRDRKVYRGGIAASVRIAEGVGRSMFDQP